MGVSAKTILVYRTILLQYGLIKKVIRRKDEKGNYLNTLYQLVRFDHDSIKKEEMNEHESVVSEVIDVPEKDFISEVKDTSEKNHEPLYRKMHQLGLSEKIITDLFDHYSKEKIKEKLTLLERKPYLHSPGAYLLSVLRNNDTSPKEHQEEITTSEIDVINRQERIVPTSAHKSQKPG
jgi:hypothetical protein